MSKSKKIETTANEVACFIVNILHGITHDSGKVMRARGMETIRKEYSRIIESGGLSTAAEEFRETRYLQAELDLIEKSKADEHR